MKPVRIDSGIQYIPRQVPSQRPSFEGEVSGVVSSNTSDNEVAERLQYPRRIERLSESQEQVFQRQREQESLPDNTSPDRRQALSAYLESAMIANRYGGGSSQLAGVDLYV